MRTLGSFYPDPKMKGIRRMSGRGSHLITVPFACGSISVTARYMPWNDLIENGVITPPNQQLRLGLKWLLVSVSYMGTATIGDTICTTHRNGSTTPEATNTTLGVQALQVVTIKYAPAQWIFDSSDSFGIRLDVAGSGSDIAGALTVRTLES